MRILIDMQGAQSESRFRGIGRYTLALVDALIEKSGYDQEILLLLNGNFREATLELRERYKDLIGDDNFFVWYPITSLMNTDIGSDNSYAINRFIRSAVVNNARPNVVLATTAFENFLHGTFFSAMKEKESVPTAIIGYDLIPHLNAKKYLDNDQAYRLSYEYSMTQVKNAAAITCISESATNEFKAVFETNVDKIVNIGSACDTNIFNSDNLPEDIDKTIEQFGIKNGYIFYVGAADSRKNLKRLIKAYTALPEELRSTYDLVFAGAYSEEEKEILDKYALKNGVAKEFKQLGYISETELVTLYKSCELHIVPSIHEGFGLSVLEAINCNAVSICSNQSSLPEIMQYPSATFDPLSVEDMKNCMEKALTKADWRVAYLAHAEFRKTQFSWDNVASRTLQVLSDVAITKCPNTINLATVVSKITKLTKKNTLSEVSLFEIADRLARTFDPKPLPRIFLDMGIMEKSDYLSGIQRTSASITSHIPSQLNKSYNIVPFSNWVDEDGFPRVSNRYAPTFFQKDENIKVGQPIVPSKGDVVINLNLNLEISELQLDWLQRSREAGARVISVVYDLIPIKFPHYWSEHPQFVPLFKKWIDKVLSYDDCICISRVVCDELATYARERELQIKYPATLTHFHIGSDFAEVEPLRSLPTELSKIENSLAIRKSFLIVGTLEPRKNHTMVLNAFEELWKKDIEINLIIVGKQGWNISDFVSRLRRHPEIGVRLFWLENAGDELLETMYEKCTCLISASEDEGFGLPLIEAARRSLPILANDIPVFREVAGNFATYYKDDSKSLARAIEVWLARFEKGKHIKSDGMPFLSWKESAAEFVQALKL